jgi:hypothetical protein
MSPENLIETGALVDADDRLVIGAVRVGEMWAEGSQSLNFTLRV